MGLFGCVFDGPTAGFQIVADGVTAFEILGLAGSLAFVEQLQKFGRSLVVSRGEGNAECGADFIPGGEAGGGFFSGHLLRGEEAVAIADPFKNGAPHGGDIEIVLEGGGETGDEVGVGLVLCV